MKVLIDTNIIISAILFPDSIPFKAYKKAVSLPNQGVISKYNIIETKRIFYKKFPDSIALLDKFLSEALIEFEIIDVPEKEVEEEKNLRDIKDKPILRAAIAENIDIIITGDKDFLESKILKPQIVTAAEFLLME